MHQRRETDTGLFWPGLITGVLLSCALHVWSTPRSQQRQSEQEQELSEKLEQLRQDGLPVD